MRPVLAIVYICLDMQTRDKSRLDYKLLHSGIPPTSGGSNKDSDDLVFASETSDKNVTMTDASKKEHVLDSDLLGAAGDSPSEDVFHDSVMVRDEDTEVDPAAADMERLEAEFKALELEVNRKKMVFAVEAKRQELLSINSQLAALGSNKPAASPPSSSLPSLPSNPANVLDTLLGQPPVSAATASGSTFVATPGPAKSYLSYREPVPPTPQVLSMFDTKRFLIIFHALIALRRRLTLVMVYLSNLAALLNAQRLRTLLLLNGSSGIPVFYQK